MENMDLSINKHNQPPWHITKNEIIVLWFMPIGISVFLAKGGHLFTLLPKGGYGLIHHTRSVMSSVMGP